MANERARMLNIILWALIKLLPPWEEKASTWQNRTETTREEGLSRQLALFKLFAETFEHRAQFSDFSL
jgi:hypothetical protein